MSVPGEDFDEEAEEREQHELHRVLGEFVDEPPVMHNELPLTESDSEEEDGDGEVRVGRQRTRIGGEIVPSEGTSRDGLYKDQTFVNGVGFKEAVIQYTLRTGRNVRQYRYDKEKIGFNCNGGGSSSDGENCRWQIYASTTPKDQMWRVRKFIDKHTCIPNGKCECIKVPVIARLFVDKIREEPSYFMPMKIEEIMLQQWRISVSRPQCQSARQKALRWIEWEDDNKFARLRDYAAEIVESNPGSSAVVECLKNRDDQDIFHRFYVCFAVIRRAWKGSCRPLIGLDGTFVSGKIKGTVLVAMGRDADNRIYPIAWGVAPVENFENWQWFLRKLKVDLDLDDGGDYIFVSDRQKGLIKAVKTECPTAEHRMCVRHIYGNLKKRHGGKKDMKPYIWNLAWSYNEAEYEDNLAKLLAYDIAVYSDVMKEDPKSWCRAFYKKGSYCEDIENNSVESFNMTIKKAREKAFVPMLETIRRLAMARIAQRSVQSHTHTGICTPYVARFLEKEIEGAASALITNSTHGYFEVRIGGVPHRVNLEKRTCSCQKYDICGIPCKHAYGVILARRLTPEDYVCNWFRTWMWKQNYEEGPILRGVQFWPSTGPAVHFPERADGSSNKVKKSDHKRHKGVNESPTKKGSKQKKRIMHCGYCGAANHNTRFHKNDPIAQATMRRGGTATVESSQGTLTQE